MVVDALAVRHRQARMPCQPLLARLDVEVRVDRLRQMTLQSLEVADTV